MDNFGQLIDTLIKAEMAGTPMHEHVAHVCDSPDYLCRHAQFEALPLVITGKVVGKAHFDHGIPAVMLKRLPLTVAEPKGLYRSANTHQADSVVVLTFETQAGSPVIVPVRHNVRIGREPQRYNLITSLYPKTGPDPEAKWKAANLLLWEP